MEKLQLVYFCLFVVGDMECKLRPTLLAQVSLAAHERSGINMQVNVSKDRNNYVLVFNSLE